MKGHYAMHKLCKAVELILSKYYAGVKGVNRQARGNRLAVLIASRFNSTYMFLRRLFSSSSSLTRFNSLASMPPYLARQLYSEALLTSCSRVSSVAFASY